MKVMVRLVVATFVAFIVTLAAIPGNAKENEKAGSATGTFQFGGTSIPIRHAVAVTRPGHDDAASFDFLVLLSESAVADKGIADAKSMDDLRFDGTKGMTGLVALIRKGLDPWVEIRHSTVTGQFGVTARFVPAKTPADRIAGRITGETEYDGKPVKFDITFDAPLIRKLPR